LVLVGEIADIGETTDGAGQGHLHQAIVGEKEDGKETITRFQDAEMVQDARTHAKMDRVMTLTALNRPTVSPRGLSLLIANLPELSLLTGTLLVLSLLTAWSLLIGNLPELNHIDQSHHTVQDMDKVVARIVSISLLITT